MELESIGVVGVVGVCTPKKGAQRLNASAIFTKQLGNANRNLIAAVYEILTVDQIITIFQKLE